MIHGLLFLCLCVLSNIHYGFSVSVLSDEEALVCENIYICPSVTVDLRKFIHYNPENPNGNGDLIDPAVLDNVCGYYEELMTCVEGNISLVVRCTGDFKERLLQINYFVFAICYDDELKNGMKETLDCLNVEPYKTNVITYFTEYDDDLVTLSTMNFDSAEERINQVSRTRRTFIYRVYNSLKDCSYSVYLRGTIRLAVNLYEDMYVNTDNE